MNPKEKIRELMPGEKEEVSEEEEAQNEEDRSEDSEENSGSESSIDRGIELKRYYEILPKRYKEKVEQEALYAAMEDNVEKITLFGMIFGFISTLAGVMYFAPFNINIRIALSVIAALIVAPATPYMFASIKAERRKKEMEEILPDAMRLVSANIKSGHTLEKAFLLSARDEFGPLADEMRDTAMEIYGGEPVEKALQNLENRMKSELFQETLKLLRDGIESGGDTADLLDSSADDIRSSLEIRDEIKSSIRMYTIFIMMAAVGGAPVLFSISVYMARKTTDMWSSTDISSQAGDVGSQIGFNMSFQAPEVNIALFQNFAMMAIVSINLFAALIISEISNGNIKQGIKYVPVFIIISLALFIGVKSAIAGAMGG